MNVRKGKEGHWGMWRDLEKRCPVLRESVAEARGNLFEFRDPFLLWALE